MCQCDYFEPHWCDRRSIWSLIINLFNFLFRIYGDIKNAVISGLNDFSVDDVTMNVLTLKAGLSLGFRSINIQGNLSLQSWIVSFLKIKSSGNLNMTLENLRISVAVRFGMVDGVMKLMDFTPTVDLGKIEFKSTGFVIGKLTMKIVNSIAQKVVMNLFKDHKDALEETVQTIVMPAANDFLKDMTISDLLQLLTGPKEPSEPCIPPAA